jgi:glutamate 5-kinase
LLPAGVVKIEGQFARGDAVIVRGPNGHEIARGLVAFDTDNAMKIVGQNSKRIEGILGYAGRSEMIHRDDLAMAGE